jgi:hypothetical protein
MTKLIGNKNKKTTIINERGVVLYDGVSHLTNEPIVAIATIKSNNVKTGNMIQTWIIRSDISPVDASTQLKDDAICGNCPHRQNTGGACYVNIAQAPSSVYKAYKKGSYKPFDESAHKELFYGRMIRLGSYGDPAAVPVQVWDNILQYSIGHTGYTHQINHKNFQKGILNICQVSADTPKQALKLQKQGLKTFRVALPDDGLLEDEIECLSDSKGLSCMACGLCDGSKQNIAIVVHGSRSNRFKSKLITQ